MCRGSTPRFFRTVLPQSSSNARSSTFAFRAYGRSPAARTASLQLRNHCNTKNAEIPDREVNSARDGARPSFFAMATKEFRICFLSGMGVQVFRWFSDIFCGSKKRKGRLVAAPFVFL